jgi:hypothetical protein
MTVDRRHHRTRVAAAAAALAAAALARCDDDGVTGRVTPVVAVRSVRVHLLPFITRCPVAAAEVTFYAFTPKLDAGPLWVGSACCNASNQFTGAHNRASRQLPPRESPVLAPLSQLPAFMCWEMASQHGDDEQRSCERRCRQDDVVSRQQAAEAASRSSSPSDYQLGARHTGQHGRVPSSRTRSSSSSSATVDTGASVT